MSEASLSEYELNEMHKGLLRTMDRAKNGKKFKTELVDALTKGFPIDHKYYKYGSDSLLHRSLWDNHNVTQILLDLGADVNVEDHNGMNALLIAAYNFKPCYDHEGNSIIPPYFKEILAKTEDVNKVPHRRIGATALGLLCMKYCQSQTESMMGAIKMLLDAEADIDAGIDWLKIYTGADCKQYYEVGEKLKAYISMYVQQKTNFMNGQEYACYDYEL